MSATTDYEIPELPILDGGPTRHLIGGDWVPSSSGQTFSTINPSTGEVLAEIADGGVEDIDRAVAAARRAFEGPWSRFTPTQRQNVLLKLADLVVEHYEELQMLDVLEMGSPRGDSPRAGAEPNAEHLRYFAGWATKIHCETVETSAPGSFFTYTLKQPVGVVGSITPWNAPLPMAIGKIGPVLASGCTMVLKPAEEASLSTLRLGELIQELDLPEGVVNIVTGAETAGAALTAHPDVDKIAFTGSVITGQKIVRAASGNLKRLALELGGKSPDIVFADADLSMAIPEAGMGVFWNTGQNCCAGTRLFVQRPVYDEFIDGLSNLARGLKVGNPLDPAIDIGPIVSQQQLDRVTGYLVVGKEEGARTVTGGERITDGALNKGYFVPPTVFADVGDEMRIAREEIFGPVASVFPFDDVDEVVRRANSTEYGLGAGVWTRDVGKAHRMARAIRSGVVWVNTYNRIDPAMPFGGHKMSGWGSELSGYGLDEYLSVKAVWINTD